MFESFESIVTKTMVQIQKLHRNEQPWSTFFFFFFVVALQLTVLIGVEYKI